MINFNRIMCYFTLSIIYLITSYHSYGSNNNIELSHIINLNPIEPSPERDSVNQATIDNNMHNIIFSNNILRSVTDNTLINEGNVTYSAIGDEAINDGNIVIYHRLNNNNQRVHLYPLEEFIKTQDINSSRGLARCPGCRDEGEFFVARIRFMGVTSVYETQ